LESKQDLEGIIINFTSELLELINFTSNLLLELGII
jgi:hypothetical protein